MEHEGGHGSRGVTRMDHGMHEGEHHQMIRRHHEQTLWVPWLVILLGFWLISTPLTFSFAEPVVQPAQNRWTWLPLETRIAAVRWNDLISGALLVIFGWRMLTPERYYSQWAACFIGIWLQFAPMILWSPSPLAYLNDTFTGVLIIALTILIPGMPGMMAIMKPGPEVPPGWSYNPSSWPQRAIMIGLAFAGWMVSRYLAAYQLGYVHTAWDPFFGGGSHRVLTSAMSEKWPISDAGLGAFSYTIEFLMGWMGGPARWRTMPWMVLFFGILVIPLGLTHIFLVISQPVAVGDWCTLCLLAALIMLPMIPLSADEVVAMMQFMRRRKAKGASLWNVFWFGDTDEGEKTDERSPKFASLPEQPGPVYRASVWGMTVPWQLAVSTLLGLWVMAAPALFGTEKPFSDSLHLTGALIVTVAVVAMGEVLRLGRFLNVLLGLWLVATPFLLDGGSSGAAVSSAVSGLAVAVLSVPRGKVREHYGSFDAWVR